MNSLPQKQPLKTPKSHDVVLFFVFSKTMGWMKGFQRIERHIENSTWMSPAFPPSQAPRRGRTQLHLLAQETSLDRLALVYITFQRPQSFNASQVESDVSCQLPLLKKCWEIMGGIE